MCCYSLSTLSHITQREQREQQLGNSLAPQKPIFRLFKTIWDEGEGKRKHNSLRLKQKWPGQENQKECPGKPGMWLLSYFKAKILTEEEDGPYFRQPAVNGTQLPWAPECPPPTLLRAEFFLKDWTHPEAWPGYPKIPAKKKAVGSML